MKFRKATLLLSLALLGCAGNPKSVSIIQSPTLMNRVALPTFNTISPALDRINQRSLPLDGLFSRSSTGKGVTVYVFDGGIGEHLELTGRIRKGFSINPNGRPMCNSHGTAVAGAIAGTTLGVASNARIVDVKIIDCLYNRGTITGMKDATKWVIEDHKLQKTPAVVNWSLIVDTTGTIKDVNKMVQDLNNAGMSVVVAAGNIEKNSCKISASNAPGVISVGSIDIHDSLDVRSSNTAWGSCISVYAPGDDIPLPSFDENNNADIILWSGTSISTAFVSGVIACYLEKHPLATPIDVYNFITLNATNIGTDGHGFQMKLLYNGNIF